VSRDVEFAVNLYRLHAYPHVEWLGYSLTLYYDRAISCHYILYNRTVYRPRDNFEGAVNLSKFVPETSWSSLDWIA